MGEIIPKNYKIGNMVYFVYDHFPHTGIIKYIHSDSFTVDDVTFLNVMDIPSSEELQIPKQDCTKTGEIYLPKFPDKNFIDLIKDMSITEYTYEAMPKRTIVASSLLSPLIIFKEGMLFLLDDENWYHYTSIYSNEYGNMPVLKGLDDTIVLPRWIAQPYFLFNTLYYEKKLKGKRVINEYNITAILQKDREYNNILKEADFYRYHHDEKYKQEMYDVLKFHTDIIYRVDHDPILGTNLHYKVPFKKIPGIIPETEISKKF